MNKLPQHQDLPIGKLAACFNNTSATYKFYWLLAIVESVEKGKTLIPKRELFALMIANAWYTVNYFHVSFGKQDKLERAIQQIKILEALTIDSPKHKLLDCLTGSENKGTVNELKYFDKQVPHWFLSPWFPHKSKQEIYHLSRDFSNLSPYALQDDFISMNLLWVNYIQTNAALLKDFCFWNLAMYLQAKNPNIPDIPNKLIKPAKRNSLIKQRNQFWDIVVTENAALKCIYTGNEIIKGEYEVEHFIPYSFVSHDLIWNLIPCDSSFNHSKSDKLPSLKKYFPSYYNFHKTAIESVLKVQPNNKYLEEYLTIIPGFESLDTDYAKRKFRETLEPLITIAANNGFQYLAHD